MKICWIDLETTGLDCKKDFVIEFAAIYMNENKTEELHLYSKPEKKPDNYDYIEKLTGIKWDFLESNGITENKLYIELDNFFTSKVDKYSSKDKMIFAGYNCGFDKDFLYNLYLKNNNKYFGSLFFSPNLDILSIIADCLLNSKIPLLENYKLATVYKSLLKKEFAAHSAIEDIRATKEIYDLLKKENMNNGK